MASEQVKPFHLTEEKLARHRKISRTLKTLRGKKGTSLDAASKAMGLSVSALNRVENGEASVSIDVVVAAVKYYGCSLGELIPLD